MAHTSRTLDLGLLLARLMPGLALAYHGAGKLFGAFGGPGLEGFSGWLESLGVPAPALAAPAAAVVELVGGLALVTGVGLRWLSLPVVVTMLVAAFTAHSGFDATRGGMEYPLTLALVVAGLGLTGPGRFVLPVRGLARERDATTSPASAEA